MQGLIRLFNLNKIVEMRHYQKNYFNISRPLTKLSCVFFRCSFHSYADSTYAKHLETGGGTQSIYGTLGGPTPIPSVTPTPGGVGPGASMSEATMTMRAETPREYQQSVIEVSEDSINSIEKVEEWKVLANGNRMPNGASPRENGKQSRILVF